MFRLPLSFRIAVAVGSDGASNRSGFLVAGEKSRRAKWNKKKTVERSGNSVGLLHIDVVYIQMHIENG